jgi:outer membrane protein insertion porin family
MYLTFQRPMLNIVSCLLLFTVLVSSCSEQSRTSVKNYPISRPFVYQNKIELLNNLPKDEKKRLLNQLDNYWDDSLKVKKVQIAGLFYKIKDPAVFDSTKFNSTIHFMNQYLNSQGYYYAQFSNSFRIDTIKDQLRAYTTISINTEKSISFDSVTYDLNDSTLQEITNDAIKKTTLIKGNPYSKQQISIELDRLVNLYRKNGYFKITREDLYALVDSTNQAVLQLTLDPFEQAKLLAAIERSKKENPNWDITIKRKDLKDSSRLYQYKVGNLFYYPETKITESPDSLLLDHGFKQFKQDEAVMNYKEGKFIYKPLKEYTYFKKGDLYNEDRYFKTGTGLSQLGAWQNVDIRPIIRDKDSLDFYFFMTPAVKQSFTIDLEGSRNTGDIATGNLLGISTNLTYNNRNVWQRAIQSVATFRTGIELNLLTSTSKQSDLLQSFFINAGHTYIFPKLIHPFKGLKGLKELDNRRTLFGVNLGYVERRTYYTLRTIITSWGYEWKKGNTVYLYKPLNIELNGLERLDSLESLIAKNPFLRASFNEGNIVSQSLSINKTIISKRNSNNSNYYRFGVEEAGGLFGLVPGLAGNIYRYIKFENEYRHIMKFKKAELAYRAFGGFGYNYGKDSVFGVTMPFYKQFFAGGPNSMRAWTLRQLGLGRSNQSELDTANNAFRDRYGDLQLEMNIEYRFLLASFGSLKLGSTIFTDIGNIWNVKKSNQYDSNTIFDISKLGNDLAIGIGTGLRFDLSYFLIRLDFAYKVKDPLRVSNGGWMSIKNFNWTDTRPNGVNIPNFALQLGIGLPF